MGKKGFVFGGVLLLLAGACSANGDDATDRSITTRAEPEEGVFPASTTTERGGGSTGPLPTEMIAVIEADETRHEVVLVDTRSGEILEVLFEQETGLPDAEVEALVSSISSVDATADQSQIAIDICCEPAAGNTWILDGGTAQ